MSLLKTIFQLNKLQKLLLQRDRIEVQTANIKQELLTSNLVQLLGSIMKESNTLPSNISSSEKEVTHQKIENIDTAEAIVASTVEIESDLNSISDNNDNSHTAETINHVSSDCQSDNLQNDDAELSDIVRQTLLVTIQSIEPENSVIYLQAEDRMFDFPYSPEDHAGASVGDTRKLIIYEDDTYLFKDIELQEVKAA